MTYHKAVYLRSFPSANNCQIYFSIYYHFLKWFIKQTELFSSTPFRIISLSFLKPVLAHAIRQKPFVLFHTEVSSYYWSWKSQLSFSEESLISSVSCEWHAPIHVFFFLPSQAIIGICIEILTCGRTMKMCFSKLPFNAQIQPGCLAFDHTPLYILKS